MCSIKDQSFHKNTIYMILRLNPGDNSIYTFYSVYSRPRHTSHEETTQFASICTHIHGLCWFYFIALFWVSKKSKNS